MPLRFRHINSNYFTAFAGIAACFVISMGLYVSASHYTSQMHYSPKNHFISELGLATASNYAYVFNLCLNFGGILLLLFTVGLGKYLGKSNLVIVATLIGMLATLNFSAIGYYTADAWTAHKHAATVFFTGAMVSIGLFSYTVFKNKQSKINHLIGLQGFIIAFIYLLVLAWPKALLLQSVYDPAHFVRPDLWGLTVLEWMYCLFIGSWILTVSFDLVYITYMEESRIAQISARKAVTGI